MKQINYVRQLVTAVSTADKAREKTWTQGENHSQQLQSRIPGTAGKVTDNACEKPKCMQTLNTIFNYNIQEVLLLFNLDTKC